MSSFKYKTSRSQFISDDVTLDGMYNDYLKKFKDQNTSIPYKKKLLKKLEKELKNLEAPSKQYRPSEIKRRSHLKGEILEIQKSIEKIESGFYQMEFYSKSHEVIRDYYEDPCEGNGDILSDSENDEGDYEGKGDDETKGGDDIVNDIDSEISNKNSVMGQSTRLKNLHEMLRKKKKIKKKPKKKIKKKKVTKSIVSILCGDGDDDKKGQIVSNKAELLDQFRSLIDGRYVRKNSRDNFISKCPKCDNDMTLISAEGKVVCEKCGTSEYRHTVSEIPSHTDAINEKPKYPYKKINHLIEKMNQFQSKETNNVPDDIFDIVETEMKKYRLNTKTVTVGFIKGVLKKYGQNKYYENRQFIFSKITKTPPLSLSREAEEEIKKRFKLLEEPYMLYRPPGRNNFLNYSFVLNKILKIMKLYSHARYFKLLKSKDKLRAQEKSWELICNYLQENCPELDWSYDSCGDNNVKHKMKITDM